MSNELINEHGKTSRKNSLEPLLVVLNVGLRFYSALYMIISDCDETFNYWEPLNLLVRGFGKETWEYSPEYAIRSYAYLIPYYILAWPMNWLVEALALPPHYIFYWIRLIALCGFTSLCEIYLYRSLKQSGFKKVSQWFLLLSSIAPGMTHAGVALLPSSFAMNCVTMATANAFSSFSHDSSAFYPVATFSWFMLAGIVGWPFSMALAIPFGLYTLLSRFYRVLPIIIGSLFMMAIISGSTLLIDSYFYQKYTLVPLNIVLYNVFGGEGEGPEIFGVEPFLYYVLNLLLNFNIVAIIGYLGLFINPIIHQRKSRVLVCVSLPLLTWSTIFGTQEHKEERFLYPIYTLVVLSASFSLVQLLPFTSKLASSLSGNSMSSKTFDKLIHVAFITLTTLISILRIFNLVENYSAPLTTFGQLSELSDTDHTVNVCTGREWYHYPNSFFMPKKYRLQFVRSGFDGLLPGDFDESEANLVASTSKIPFDMNNKNLFSESKVIDFNNCSYYVDNSGRTADIEPKIIEKHDKDLSIVEGWSVISCNKIINPDGDNSALGRHLWLPNVLKKRLPHKVDYMEFCLLRKH